MIRPTAAISGTFIATPGVWVLLMLWQQLAAGLNCLGTILLMLPLWVSIALASAEPTLLRRWAFIRSYLEPAGGLARWLKGWTLRALWIGVVSLVPTLLLLVTVQTMGPGQMAILLADVVVVMVLLRTLPRWLRHQVNEHYAPVIARIWTHRINVVLLWAALLSVALVSGHENYLGMSWEDVVHYTTSRVEGGCDVLALLSRVAGAFEGLSVWSAQHLSQGLAGARDRTVLVWLIFAAAFGVSFVVAWAYSRALIGPHARPWLFWAERPDDIRGDA